MGGDEFFVGVVRAEDRDPAAGSTRRAFDALRTLRALRTLCAGRADRTLRAFDNAGVDPVAVFVSDKQLAADDIRVAGVAGRVCGDELIVGVVRAKDCDALTSRTGRAGFALDALRALRADCALRADWAGFAGNALRTGRACFAYARRAGWAFGANGALRAFGTGCAFRTLYFSTTVCRRCWSAKLNAMSTSPPSWICIT